MRKIGMNNSQFHTVFSLLYFTVWHFLLSSSALCLCASVPATTGGDWGITGQMRFRPHLKFEIRIREFGFQIYLYIYYTLIQEK
jgi:hypothetical protein